jgi:hypothetical protein
LLRMVLVGSILAQAGARGKRGGERERGREAERQRGREGERERGRDSAALSLCGSALKFQYLIDHNTFPRLRMDFRLAVRYTICVFTCVV